MRKNVLVVSTGYPAVGGITSWVEAIKSESCHSMDFRIDHLNTSANVSQNTDPSFFLRVKEGFNSSVLLLSDFINRLSNADILHVATSGSLGHIRTLFFLFFKLVLRPKMPTIMHLHYDPKKRGVLDNGLMRILALFCRYVIVLDESAQFPSGKFKYLPNGVTKNIHLSEKKENVVIFAGWIRKEKGIFDLLECWVKNPPETWSLKIFGKATPENLRKINEYVDRCDSVCFMGEVGNDIVKYELAKAKVFCLPSHSEGLPVSILEAMSAHCTILATNVGGIPSIFEKADVGILLDVNNLQASLAAALSSLNDVSVLECFSDSALRLFCSDYDVSNTYKKLEEIWTDALR